MNLVFWGTQAHCGTSANMRAVAGMLEMMCADRQTLRGADNKPVHFRLRDAGSGGSPGRADIWKQADLLVINVSRERECMERFFDEHLMLARRSFVLLSSFPGEGTGSVDELVHRYRLGEEACGMIGENAAYYLAAGRGRSKAFVRQEYKMPKSLRNEQFLRELKKTTERIVRLAECRTAECRTAQSATLSLPEIRQNGKSDKSANRKSGQIR